MEEPPGLFILCGNFVSPTGAAIDVAALKAHFTSLAHLLLSFSGLLVGDSRLIDSPMRGCVCTDMVLCSCVLVQEE